MTILNVTSATRNARTNQQFGRYVDAVSPFTPVLGLVRSVIAGACLFTLLFTPTEHLFFRSVTFPTGANCSTTLSWLSLFCLGAQNGQLELTKWIAIILLLVVAAGVRPSVTALPHWWVTWSLMTSSTAIDGGEHLAADLTLILVPLLLIDRRRWHWEVDRGYSRRGAWVKATGYACLGLWILQMMGVYFQASVAKFAVLEWSDGTALWYWMQNPVFAPSAPIGPVIRWALQWLPITAALTYGTLVLQLALVGAVFASERARRVLLLLAVAFHLAIASIMGLWSFSLIMIAADVLLLVRPHEARRLSVVLHRSTRRGRNAAHESG